MQDKCVFRLRSRPKIYVVRWKSNLSNWIEKGAIYVPGEEQYVLVSSLPEDHSDIIRVGNVSVKDDTLVFSTDRILVEFEHPQPSYEVEKAIGLNDAVSMEPLEKNAVRDWSWVIHLKPEIDPEVKAKDVSLYPNVKCAEPDRIHMGWKRHPQY